MTGLDHLNFPVHYFNLAVTHFHTPLGSPGAGACWALERLHRAHPELGSAVGSPPRPQGEAEGWILLTHPPIPPFICQGRAVAAEAACENCSEISTL